MFDVAHELILFQILATESATNSEQYFAANSEVGMYALRRNIKLLESFAGLEVLSGDRKALAWDITFSYARLGKLENKLGRTIEANEAYSHAWEASMQTGRDFKSLADLLLAVDNFDRKYLETKSMQGTLPSTGR